MTKQEIIAEIVANIKTNGKKEISGKTLQYVLLLLTQNTFNVDEEIPISTIQSLQAALDLKQDKDAVVKGSNVALWDANEICSKTLNIYRSYQNINSSHPEFRSEAIYRCILDTLAGESPETHPEKWIRQSSDISALAASLDAEVKERKDDFDELIALIETEANSRIDADALKIDVNQKGSPNGVASLDQSGLVPISQIPQSVLERLTIVADQAARYALTIAQVQNGDTVKQSDTGEMWYVKDQSMLNNENGYMVYTAGTASSVPWSGITGKQAATTSVLGISKLSVAPVDAANPVVVGENDPRVSKPSAADMVRVSTGTDSYVWKAISDFKIWLGLKSAAFSDIGNTAGTVASGDDSRIVGAVQKSLATAIGQVLVSSAVGVWVVNTYAQLKASLGLDQVTNDAQIPKSIATAADQVLVSTGAGTWIVRTFQELRQLLGLGGVAQPVNGIKPVVFNDSTGLKTDASPANLGYDEPNGTLYVKQIVAAGGISSKSTVFAQKSGIATTSTDGLTAENTTPATVAVPVQQSPRMRWRGSVWDTLLGVSKTINMKAELFPTSGNTPTAKMSFSMDMGSGVYTEVMAISSNGTASVPTAPVNPTDVARKSEIDAIAIQLPTNVGIGGQYTSVYDALVDGKQLIMIISNVTERSNYPNNYIVVTKNTVITSKVPGLIWNIGSNKFDLQGWLDMEFRYVDFRYTTIGGVFGGASVGGNRNIRFFYSVINNQATADNCRLNRWGAGAQTFWLYNTTFNLANQWDCGFGSMFTEYAWAYLYDSVLNGGGSNCSGIGTTYPDSKNVKITGIWGTREYGMAGIGGFPKTDGLSSNIAISIENSNTNLVAKLLTGDVRVLSGDPFVISSISDSRLNSLAMPSSNDFNGLHYIAKTSRIATVGSFCVYAITLVLEDCDVDSLVDTSVYADSYLFRVWVRGAVNLNQSIGLLSVGCEYLGNVSIGGKNQKFDRCFFGRTTVNQGGTASYTPTVTVVATAMNTVFQDCVFTSAPVLNSTDVILKNCRLWDGTRLPDRKPLPPIFANNAAATAGGLSVGCEYRTGGDPDLICIVH